MTEELFVRIAATGLIVAMTGAMAGIVSVDDQDPKKRLERMAAWFVRVGFAFVFVGAIGMAWTIGRV